MDSCALAVSQCPDGRSAKISERSKFCPLSSLPSTAESYTHSLKHKFNTSALTQGHRNETGRDTHESKEIQTQRKIWTGGS